MMTIEMLKDEAYKDAIVIFSNTGKENEETLQFVHAVDQHIGGRVVWLEFDPVTKFRLVTFETASRDGKPFEDIITKRKFLPNKVARFCTQELKIRPMKQYLQSIGWTHWTNHVGIRYDEPRRHAKMQDALRKDVFDVNHPLFDWKVTKADVLRYWRNMPFDLQLPDHYGNCDLCFLKGMKKKQAIARQNPEKFDWWIRMEKKVGSTFMSEMSYTAVRDFVSRSPEFSFDDSIECFCNAD